MKTKIIKLLTITTILISFLGCTEKDDDSLLGESKTPAVIVIRHAIDVNEGAPHPGPLTFQFFKTIELSIDGKIQPPEKTDSIYIPIFRNLLCNNSGYKRADDLGIGLQQFIEDNNLAPVSEVISINPPKDYDSGTPNPFLTIAPYITNMQEKTTGLPDDKLKLTLYNSHDYIASRFDGNLLIKDGFSSIISWEATGMWQVERHGGYNENTILPQLVKEDQIDLVMPKPIWATTIYLFTNIDNGRFDLQKYDFSVQGDGEDKEYIFTKCDNNSCTEDKPECKKE